MNRFQHEIVTSLWKQKKYDGIREFLQVMYGKNNVIFEEYDGVRPRLFVNENDDIVLMLPTEMDVVMENAVVDSIENGTIFDDAHVVNNTAKYIRMTGLPYNGLMNKNIDEPKHMVATIGSVIGTMDDKGRFGCDDCDVQNGVNAMKDMMDHSNDEPCATMKLVGNYIDLKKDGKLPKDYRKSLGKVSGEVEKIKEVEADDTVGPDDYRELELTDECGSMCNPVEEEDTVSDDSSTSSTSSTSSDDNTTADTSAVPTDDTSMSNGSSTESSYSDNGPDNSEVEQEAYYVKPGSLRSSIEKSLHEFPSVEKWRDYVTRGKYSETSELEDGCEFIHKTVDNSLYNWFKTAYDKMGEFYSIFRYAYRSAKKYDGRNLREAIDGIGSDKPVKQYKANVDKEASQEIINNKDNIEALKMMLQFEISEFEKLEKEIPGIKKDFGYFINSCKKLADACDKLMNSFKTTTRDQIDGDAFKTFYETFEATYKTHRLYLKRFESAHASKLRDYVKYNRGEDNERFYRHEQDDLDEKKFNRSIGGKIYNALTKGVTKAHQLATEYCIDIEDAAWLISEYGVYYPEFDEFIQEDSIDDTCDTDTIQEGFFTRKPKRLKPIPRDTVAYITIELGAAKDSNDFAMLSGYTCSKLEMVDFYLNCIDTQDDRYIVPHTRQYLVQLQHDLNQLLTRILQISPRNKMDRIWKPGVTLPMNV